MFLASTCGFTPGIPPAPARRVRRRTATKGFAVRPSPEETVRIYAEGMGSSGVLVAALDGDRVKRIVAAYREYGAADIDTREAEWRGTSSSNVGD